MEQLAGRCTLKDVARIGGSLGDVRIDGAFGQPSGGGRD